MKQEGEAAGAGTAVGCVVDLSRGIEIKLGPMRKGDCESPQLTSYFRLAGQRGGQIVIHGAVSLDTARKVHGVAWGISG